MIVKDAQKEKSKLKSLEYHKKKLEEISQQPIKLPDQEIMKKISEKHKNQQAMLKFQKSEALLEQQRNNQVIINRLLNNYSSKPKTSQQPKREFRTQQYDKINEENRSLANRIMNLPPVVNMKRYEQEYTKHQSDLVIMQKYHQTVRLTDCQDDSYKILNELTNGKFAKSKFTNMTFTGHVNRMKRFVFFQVEELILFNQRHKYKGKNIAYFSWVIETNNKQIKKTPPLEFEQFETVLQDFLISDSFVGIQLNLLKMKQNEVFDMGYFLYSETQSHIETIGLKDHLVLRVSDYINDDIKKNINEETVKVGTIKYRMIQICKSRVQNTQVSQYQIQVQNHNE